MPDEGGEEDSPFEPTGNSPKRMQYRKKGKTPRPALGPVAGRRLASLSASCRTHHRQIQDRLEVGRVAAGSGHKGFHGFHAGEQVEPTLVPDRVIERAFQLLPGEGEVNNV